MRLGCMNIVSYLRTPFERFLTSIPDQTEQISDLLTRLLGQRYAFFYLHVGVDVSILSADRRNQFHYNART